MKSIFFIVFSLFTLISFSQKQIIDSIPKDGIVLNKGWKFHAGDNAEWSKPDFDDSKWQLIDPTLDVLYLPQLRQQPIGWLRIHFQVDSNLLNKPLAYHIFQSIASQVYINGKLTDSYGVVSSDKNKIKEWRPSNNPEGIVFTKPEQTIAVRFSLQQTYLPFFTVSDYNCFIIRISKVEEAAHISELKHQFPYEFAILTTVFILISLVHLVLFIKRPSQNAYLYFAIAMFLYGCVSFLGLLICFSNVSMTFINYAQTIISIFLIAYTYFLYFAIFTLFSSKHNIMFWIISIITVSSPFFYYLTRAPSYVYMVAPLISSFESARIAVSAYRRNNKNAYILILGYMTFWITIFLVFLLIINSGAYVENYFNLKDFLWVISVVAIPLSLMTYISLDFAGTSKSLDNKLHEIQQLSQEKQQILLSQNETLEQQVQQRTYQLNKSIDDLKSTQAQLIQSEKMASLGELTAGIAHEIQNPLNFVNNFSEVNTELLEELEGERSKVKSERDEQVEMELLADIKENEHKINFHGKRADAIVKGMLQHSRTNTGKKEPTDINALCDEYLRLSYHGLRAKDKSFDADFKTNFDESIGKINIIPQDIGRVLLNLYNHAFYAVSEKQKVKGVGFKANVSVQTIKLSDNIELHISDNGAGIPQNIVDKIFQPFFSTKPTGQGTGLGLSLAYDIIKAHGGEIKVETKEGEGSEFIIKLPIV